MPGYGLPQGNEGLLPWSWAEQRLKKSHISDNVGGVKWFSSTRQHALGEERHFALVEAVAFALPTKARW